jgi:soluble lytic murein transglycosylase-like protein
VPAPPPTFELDFLETHPVPEAPYGPLIHQAARRHRVNPGLVAAIIRCESAFDPHAISPRGAQGLLQLMPATAERFGVDPVELHDPARNIEAGVRYLRFLADRFDNDLARVLAAYNSGEGTVDRFRGVPPYRETREYLRRVYLELGLASAL